jgi:hypothetical protein
MSDELSKLLRETFEYSMTDIHTALPGVVVKYDAKTRRADIQPSLKRKMPGEKFMDFPIIPEVPVMFFGTKKYTVHIPLEKDDEVLLIVSERGTDTWKNTGGKGIEETDPRRFDLQDCFAIPGLQPVDFISVEEAGLNIVHKSAPDGDFISSVTMDDNGIEAKYKKKADIMIQDDDILAMTEKCSFDMSGEKLDFTNGTTTITTDKDKVIFDNGKNKFELAGTVSLISTGQDLVEIGNTVATLGGVFDELFSALLSLHTEGAPAAHTASTWGAASITPLQTKSNMVFKK